MMINRTSSLRTVWSVSFFVAIALLLSSCDFYRKRKCEWYLVPEPDHLDRVEAGWVPLCARNYVVNKQRCNLKARFDFAQDVYGYPFRYSSLKIKGGPFPKEVESVTVCGPKYED